MASRTTEQAKKRKTVPKYHDFRTFADPDHFDTVSFSGAFEGNIRVFVDRFAEELVDSRADGVSIWRFFLVYDGGEFLIPLYTIAKYGEFPVDPFCNHCESAGLKYHVIIPVDEEWKKPFSADVCEFGTHLLHGVIHFNGIGHLVCINGREGGSKQLLGQEIMDLWDRICGFLRVRKITVHDVSKKRGMDLSLLHGIAYGHSWFGRWGYRVLCPHFDKSLQLLSSLELDQIIRDFSSTKRCKEIKNLICCYREASETDLITLRDLLVFMLTLKRRPKESRVADSSEFATIARKKKNSRWSVERMKLTADLIVEALKINQVENTCMSRNELKLALRQQIGDTGLIDTVLTLIDNVAFGDYVVRRVVNTDKRTYEYKIEGLNIDSAHGVLENRDDIWADVSYMYNKVPLESDTAKGLGRTALNSKYLVKKWPSGVEPAYPNEQDLKCLCERCVVIDMPSVGNAGGAKVHQPDKLTDVGDDDEVVVKEEIHTLNETGPNNTTVIPAGPNSPIAESQRPLVRIAGEDPYTRMKSFAEDVYKKHELEVYFKASIPKGVVDSKVTEISVGIKELWKWFQPKGWVSGEHLVIWSRYLYERMTKEDKNRVQLVNPSLVYSNAKISKDQQIDGISQNLADFMVANEAKLYLVPYLLRSHWVLLVFQPDEKIVYKFDSLQLKRSHDFETFTKRMANKWYLLNKRVQTCPLRDYKWKLVDMEHKLQPYGWECGFYIMIWMEQITLHVPHLDLRKEFPQDKSACLDEEVLRDLIVRWCEYVVPTFLNGWIAQANDFIKRKFV